MVNATTAATAAASSASGSSTGKQEMGTDLFLQLLVTQMRYQDPLSGQQDTGELMTQLTLFTMLERMVQLQQSLDQQSTAQAQTRALDLLNRTVEVQDSGGNVRRGEVTAVIFEPDRTRVAIDGIEYPDSAVVRVVGEAAHDL